MPTHLVDNGKKICNNIITDKVTIRRCQSQKGYTGDVLEIVFEDDSVRELFEDLCQIQGSKGLMNKKIGAKLTRLVKKRYDHLRAADTFLEYLNTGLGRPHSLTNMDGCYGVFVDANWRLIVKPMSEDLSAETLKKCEKVQIKGVLDYHGKGAKNNWIIP